MHSTQQLQSGELAGAKHIKISENLTDIPQALYQYADTLEVLDLSGNELTALPNDFARFKNLRTLFLSNNKFEVFPEVLSHLTHLDIVGFKANQIKEIPEHALPVSLRWLILTDNKITALPHSIGLCINLQKVMLAGNQLDKLPDEMASCTRIELLRISANKLQSIPAWLFSLPKLAWLAFAGNPCSFRTAESAIEVDVLSWNLIEIQQQLGEGASGNIYKAVRKDSASDIAVKIFKGAVTSDGLPVDEMRACIQAGIHENMVSVKAVITDHPDHKEGLVMDLISSDYNNLGFPPSHVTCTRDVFSTDQVFTLAEVIRISRGIASVAVQLHEKGIMHGDLYAHNILVNKNGHPLFGDFGAATIFSPNDPALAKRLEQIEVRAYGCLVEDLLNLLAMDQLAEAAYITEIKNQCMNEDIESRPTFKSILERLQI
ncbi:leucine-rich repeat-containing protein kinase family protein [Cytophaga aurantiaca]|uniref:leucine-rich repeat-containing protein kinase family protein n=1 Tax=Cytophaga aurantiaca TaxID=29530 RepID=UPI00035C89AE|nr:leucine-rich repeat-containing protein kinase family protein [Cytophaga aurantiaca]